MTIDPNLIGIISILAMALVSGIVAWRSGGIQAGASKTIEGVITNPKLSSTVETRLNAIPQDKRDMLISFIDLATPITDTSTISQDAAQWIKNVLDGNAATGAIHHVNPDTPVKPSPSQPLPAQPTNPAEPQAITKALSPYETRLDFPDSRQVHVPINMAFVYLDTDAAGKKYPLPNINVNPAYGASFNIASVAGSWGFTFLTTLVKDVRYKVIADYSAAVTGDKIGSLSDWLWWELEIDYVGIGENQGMINGERKEAVWEVVGTGKPMMISPRIHAQWASAGDMSKVDWHNLEIIPAT